MKGGIWLVLGGLAIIFLSLIFPTIGEEIVAIPLGVLMIALGSGFSLGLL